MTVRLDKLIDDRVCATLGVIDASVFNPDLGTSQLTQANMSMCLHIALNNPASGKISTVSELSFNPASNRVFEPGDFREGDVVSIFLDRCAGTCVFSRGDVRTEAHSAALQNGL